jgi:hypothetical protein
MGYYPGRFLVGTTKRIIGAIKSVKSQPEIETSWSILIRELIQKADNRRKNKKAKERQALAKKHNVSFSD